MAKTEPVEYHRDTGDPDQLAKGQAQAANEAVQQATKPAEAQAGGALPQEASTAPPAPSPAATESVAPQPVAPEPTYTPTDDREKLLYGPTEHPGEALTAGMNLADPPPPGVDAWLPYLAAAAADPNAPHQTQGLFAYVMQRLRAHPA